MNQRKKALAQVAAVQAASDQTWAHAAERLDQIQRVALKGPDGSESDVFLVRAVFCMVAGEILFRRDLLLRDQLEGGK